MKFAVLFAGLVLAPVSVSAQVVHQASFVHDGQALAVTYEPKVETSLRQAGLGARGIATCLWTSRTVVQRTAHGADGQPIAALTRPLAGEVSRSGQRAGYCVDLSDETKAGFAGGEATRSRLAAVASADAQELRTELASLRR